MKQLSEREKATAREYAVCFNQNEAMKKAGYSPATARTSAHRVFNKPAFQLYLKSLIQPVVEKQELSAQKVLDEIQKLAFASMPDYYKWSESKKKFVLKPLDELTPAQCAAIKSYKPGEYYELYDKGGALDKLAKYYKLYSEIDATVTNFVLMPTIKYGGKDMEFNVGKPAPKSTAAKKD